MPVEFNLTAKSRRDLNTISRRLRTHGSKKAIRRELIAGL
jgi:hypothetical protein